MEYDPKDLERLSENQLRFLHKYKLNDDQLAIALAVDKEARAQNINPDFVWPMVYQESKFNADATSPKGAFGVMQLMEKTAKDLNVDRNDVDENIRGGIALLKELTSNPIIGNDPYKVLAGYNASTEKRNKFYESGNLDDLPDETLKHMHAVAKIYGGDLPDVNFEQKTPEQQPRDVTASNDTNGAPNTNLPSSQNTNPNQPPEDTKLQQALGLGAIGGIGGAIVGAGVQRGAGYFLGHPVAQMAVDTAQEILNRPVNESTKTSPNVQNTTPEGYPVSEYQARPTSSNAPTNVSLSEPRQTRTERNVQGAIDESGATGRERGTAYNTRTAQEAARVKQVNAIAQKLGLSTDEVLARYPDLTATSSGILVSKDTGQQLLSEQQKQQELQAQRARDQEILNQRAQQRRLSQQKAQSLQSATKAGAEWQKMATQAAEMQKSSDSSVRANGKLLFNKAVDLWSKGIPNVAGRVPALTGGAGAGLGFAAPYAVEQFQNGDTQGALRTLGIGVGTGAALATVPARTVPVVNAGLQGLEAYQRGKQGDYVGSATSALGAVAPYLAPFALGPEVGIPVGLATAVGAPVVNYVKDKYFPYKSVVDKSQ
jgi:hypothetical protein